MVTLEIEQIAPLAMEAAARHAPLRPHAEAVWVVQDRVRQKEWLSEHGFPDAEAVHTAEESLIFALPPELRRDLRAAGRS